MSEESSRVRRPHVNLLKYYGLFSLLFGPLFPIVFAVLFFRFRTLEYVFDDEGITMRWGVLFRREISLTYARIQDIHLVSNLIERRLQLGKVQIQTAAGSSVAEIIVEGLIDFEDVRDHLYERMRGVGKAASAPPASEDLSEGPQALAAPEIDAAAPPASLETRQTQDVVAALREAAGELRALREVLERRGSTPGETDPRSPQTEETP